MNTQRPTHEEIAKRAYEIYITRGSGDGHDRDDWLQAEYELMQLPVRKIAQLALPKQWKNKKKSPSLIHVVQAALGAERGSAGQQPSA